ncbi:amylo-alpha-1,6-glucosidase [Gaoshiqia sp. Z1-71]|uniref:amylo-alpha-1,6-glucosidase n=1 Tax=Gaoshiqia hydrogeniformans TaxID=3290090 RepID=UPI003BF91EB7
MSYLKFDKSSLVNLEYSLSREVLRSNRAGSYISTTISGCNTRKYHGLLICPVPQLGGKHVLLSSLDETVIQHGAEFNLGIHKYEGEYYEPKGHKYIRDFDAEMVPKTTWRVGGVVLSKERLLVENEEQALARYTLIDAHSPTVLRFKPFLAFRSVHALSKANMYANTKYIAVQDGIKMQIYDGYPFLYMQFSKEAEFIPVPDWYHNIEYLKEKERGYDYQEDLFVPGYFEVPIAKGESIVFSASTFEAKPASLKGKFTKECNKRIPRISFLNCLSNSAQQFVMRKGKETDIIAGFPWYNGNTRQAFVALPGLTLALNDRQTFEDVVDTQLSRLKDGLFPKSNDAGGSYAAIDTSLWFFWAIQQLAHEVKSSKYIWEKYGPAMKQILSAYKAGTKYGIRMADNGLVYGSGETIPLSWMDSSLSGKPVVRRTGALVEVNALWYNAICFALELAHAEADNDFIADWDQWPSVVAQSFNREFWSDEHGYLADWVNETEKDRTVRPNMVIATAMEYSPLDREKQKSVLSVVKKQLLTPRGLRSLSPEDPRYEGMCNGNVSLREKAVHQGTAWPWLIQFFVEGYLKVHKRGGLPFVKGIVDGFEEDMSEHCIGSIAEMYNGNPPHSAKGAISQAWSIGSVLRALKILTSFDE